MIAFILFLHVIGAVGMGLYIVLPFLLGRITRLAGAGQQGLADGLLTGNRIAQYFLIIQFLTGGYLISQADYTVLWIVLVLVLFLAIAAVAGIMTKPLKRIGSSIQQGQSATGFIKRAQTMSYIVLILYLIIIYLMMYPQFRDIP